MISSKFLIKFNGSWFETKLSFVFAIKEKFHFVLFVVFETSLPSESESNL